MNPLIIFGACAACAAVLSGRREDPPEEVGGFGPWSGGHRVPVARGGQRQKLWGGPTGHKYPVQQDFRSQVRRPPPTIPYQQQSYYGAEQQTITVTHDQMRTLHREGEVEVDGILLKYERPPRREGGGRGRRSAGSRDRVRATRPGVSGFGAPLTSAQRHKLKDSQFGLPKQRKYPLWDAEGPSRGHAIAAKGRALTAMRDGFINKRQYNQIVRKADGVLRELGDR